MSMLAPDLPRSEIRSPYARLWFLIIVFAVAFGAIGARLVWLSATSPVQVAAAAADPADPLPASGFQKARSDIFDRNGILLATNLVKPSLCANGHVIKDPESVTLQLISILPDLDIEQTIARMQKKRWCTFIKRGLTREEQYRINSLGIVGLDFQDEQFRSYPHGKLAAHVVGLASVENSGLQGVEQSMNRYLTGGSGPVQLSLDLRLQSVVSEEVQRAIDTFEAKAGAGVLMDVHTGEILALVSLPDFDPHNLTTDEDEGRFNRATHGVYELGSIFKLFTTAMALDSGIVKLGDEFDASQPMVVAGGDFRIRDFLGQNRVLSVREVLQYSSNIGAAKMAEKVGTAIQQQFLREVGLLSPAPVELPEVGKPAFPSIWRPVNTMTIAYGHGLSVSPLQLTAAGASLVNGGLFNPPTLLKRRSAPTGATRIITEDTSAVMRDLMEMVVDTGSGKKANARGWSVGGKTGTADKASRNGYDRNRRIASFFGAFPIRNPRYVGIVMVDEPVPQEEISKYATAGHVSAPAFRRIVERAAPLLGLTPDQPEELEDLMLSTSAEQRDSQL